jgi:hypothetical protein
MIPSAVRTGHPTCIRRGNRYFTRLSANFYNLILRQAYNSFESDQNSSPKNVLSGQRRGLPPLMIYSQKIKKSLDYTHLYPYSLSWSRRSHSCFLT